MLARGRSRLHWCPLSLSLLRARMGMRLTCLRFVRRRLVVVTNATGGFLRSVSAAWEKLGLNGMTMSQTRQKGASTD